MREDTIAWFVAQHFPNGKLTARDLLELARPEHSAIHDYFEWDDSIAAERYRLDQARVLIRSIKVEVAGQEIRKFIAPIFTEASDNGEYLDIQLASNIPSVWDAVIKRALSEANSWKDRYQHISEFRGVVGEIEQLNEKSQNEKETTSNKRTRRPDNPNPTYKLRVSKANAGGREPVTRTPVLREGKTPNRGKTAKTSSTG